MASPPEVATVHPSSAETLVKEAYRAFNARDAEAALATLHENVEWDDGEGRMLSGRTAVREHWHQQWSVADPQIRLVTLAAGLDSAIARIQLKARIAGERRQSDLENRFTFADGHIRSMRIRPAMGNN